MPVAVGKHLYLYLLGNFILDSWTCRSIPFEEVSALNFSAAEPSNARWSGNAADCFRPRVPLKVRAALQPLGRRGNDRSLSIIRRFEIAGTRGVLESPAGSINHG